MVLLLASAAAALPVSAPTPSARPAAALGTAQPQQHGRFGFLTAGEMADKCSANSAFSTSFCFAYLAGIHDSMRAYEVWLTQHEFCAPPQVSLEDLRNAFVGFVAANPSFRSAQSASVAVTALKKAYPCSPTSL